MTDNLFARAADIIEEHGLISGDYIDNSGGCCTVGALALADGQSLHPSWSAPDFDPILPAMQALALELRDDLEADELLVYDNLVDVIADWSDTLAVTNGQAEVVAKLRQLAGRG